MKPIKCQQCNAPIPWDGVSIRLECPYCGTVYERQPEGTGSQKRYLDDHGQECLVGYYPPDFHGSFQIRNQGNQFNIPCIEKPIKVYYQMSSADGSAHILYITSSVYHHIENTPANKSRQNYCGMDGIRYRSFVGAGNYSNIRFMEEHPQAKQVNVVKVEEPCMKVSQSLEAMKRQNAMNPSYQNEFSGKLYRYTENGNPQLCLVRLGVECMEQSPMFSPFNSMLGGLFGRSRTNKIWGVFNEIYFWGSEDGLNRYWNEFEKVYETIKPGPAFHQAEQMAQQMLQRANQQISNNAMNMFQAQMESSNRMGQMINETYSYGMELDRQSYANTSATMDRVNRMRSEAIRGVNSYDTGSGTYVEADVRFDNVYRNNTYSDVYAATEGAIEMGSEWTVLRK